MHHSKCNTWCFLQDGHRKTGSYAATAVHAAAAAAGAVVAGPAAVLNAGVATFMRVMRL